MSPLLEIFEEQHGDVPVLRLEGEIDISNIEEIRARMHGLMTNRSRAMIVDLSPTTYLDSAGINLLFSAGEEMRGRQQELHVVLPGASPVMRMVSLTGLDKALPTHPSLADALAAVGRP